MRKPIETVNKRTIICDDGSMWTKFKDLHKRHDWIRIENIPQDQNELEKLKSLNEAMFVTIKEFHIEAKNLKGTMTIKDHQAEAQANVINDLKTVEIPDIGFLIVLPSCYSLYSFNASLKLSSP